MRWPWTRSRRERIPELNEPQAKALLDQYRSKLAENTLAGHLEPALARAQLVGAAQMLEMIVQVEEAPKKTAFRFPGTPRTVK